MTLTSLLIIVLQSPLAWLFTKYLHQLLAMTFCTLIMAVELGMVGEMLFMRTSDAIVSDLAKTVLVGNYFGVALFVYDEGGTIGNTGGGCLMKYTVKQNSHSMLWLLFAGKGIVGGVTYLFLRVWHLWAAPLCLALKERTKNPPLVSTTVAEERERERRTSPLRKKKKT